MMIWLRSLLIVAGVATASHAGEPSVTDARSPAPTSEVARRWILASFEAEYLDYDLTGSAGSEPARMLAALRNGKQLRGGIGWYNPGQTRFGWNWFAERFDTNRDGSITRTELSEKAFITLDRDRDGEVTRDDFDWSDRSAWAKQSGVALRFFRSIDRDGSGKVDESEMLAHFKKLAGEKGHVSPEDLRDAYLQAAAVESGKGQSKPNRGANPVWMSSLLGGDLGSAFSGPRVGETAPDFTLSTQDGKRTVTLSDSRDQRPVVLIFGSFT